jgi:ribulose-phosphate 3-epimerase
MVKDPGWKLSWFDFQPGERVAIHAEGTSNLLKDVLELKRLGCKAVVAINPGTPVATIGEVARFIDGVLVMAINPGFAGQQMIPGIPDKIRRLRILLIESGVDNQVDIEVDGHVTFDNSKELESAGASLLVAGTSLLFNDKPLAENINTYRRR